MRQYKQWHSVATPDYKSYWGKSYGANDRTETTINVGSSSTNSYQLVQHSTRRTQREDGNIQFSFLVDGVVVKEAIFNPKTKKLVGEPISYISVKQELQEQQELHEADPTKKWKLNKFTMDEPVYIEDENHD